MKYNIINFLILLMISLSAQAQNVSDSLSIYKDQNLLQINGYQRILQNLEAVPNGMTFGGYAEVLYNQPEAANGEIDVQRLILLFGYKFDDRTQFVTEVEFEHVKEVYIEQAFVNYAVNNSLNVRAGLMLVPMGIINEYHEPTTFNGVERPSIDNKLVPTTWREIGIGLSGRSDALSLRYQAYIFNGFLSSPKNKVCSIHQSNSSSFIPFHAYTGVPVAAIAAAAWSWVEKILQELQVTSAPKACKVSIKTAV